MHRRHSTTADILANAGVILPAFALVFLSACDRHIGAIPPPPPPPTTSRSSPIIVADGSMVVRAQSGANQTVSNNGSTYTVTISETGFQACAIASVNSSGQSTTPVPVVNQNWTITSDTTETDSTINNGQSSNGTIIYAVGPNAQSIQFDPRNEGPGYQFGVEQIQFTPASLSIVGGQQGISLACGTPRCWVVISYKDSCQ